MTPTRTVFLVARRELNTRLRTRSFAIGTVVTILVLAGYLLLQASLAEDADRSKVGLSGQATGLAAPLTATAKQLGHTVEVSDVKDPSEGERMVRDGDLDAFVSGTADRLRVTVRSELDENLHKAMNALAQQQVLEAQLLAAEVPNTREILENAARAHVQVDTLERVDPQKDQRLAVALVLIVLLYMSLLLYGTMVAQGVVEEKASRVVEILLATVRPWQLLLGKVIGLGIVGLIQFTLIGVTGLAVALATDVLTIDGAATGALVWGLIWYVLGYFLFATVFASVGSLVSRQEDAQSVLTPITLVVAVAFVLGLSLLTRSADDGVTVVLSLVPPFSPILMPGRIALGVASGWEIALSVILTVTAIAALTWLGGRVYRNAVLRTGSRVRLRDALGV
ncbi:ABC-2 type transport system permease protein [Herbihabitans rhizosphaerae]|uniref:ABC-2 type transport system permease protein n=1 Tax=Herbihabitans rhizosphaerae TaxID=1872711 RepID=A0A4Q7KVB5_9PSEU|nr:ABC transporter permease [Herbihabitans rhizosphaerae]RZS40958.1 ABC-2 type transport system permease protein [Herbihabitans rhizosphaerae]